MYAIRSYYEVGYSPERINPGDKTNTLDNIVKVVSGQDQETLEIVALVYESIISAGVHRAPSIKVAEAAKVIENTHRITSYNVCYTKLLRNSSTDNLASIEAIF